MHPHRTTEVAAQSLPRSVFVSRLVWLRTILESATASPWVSYVTILLLQVKVVWGMWQFRDLTSGDTSSYFVDAYGWYQQWSDIICWSPLYTSFYGSFLHLSTDAYVATIGHRLAIVLTLALLVLALMRRLLPHNLAWFVSAWWVVLPVNFDTAYEVHIFAVIPAVAAFLVASSGPGPRRRGLTTGVLLGSALLMRNELLLATVPFSCLCAAWEIYARRKAGAEPAGRLARSYGVPLAVVALLVLGFYSRSRSKFPELSQVIQRKHTLNICQIYAFGYQQRHTDWHKSSWTECQDLMMRDFGAAEPSFVEAFRRNPRAVVEHLQWDASLIPGGLQISLFNSMSGHISPDYFPVQRGSRRASILTALLLVIALLGTYRLAVERIHWWEHWFRQRVWGWMAMACVSSTVVIVMLTQRPRPSYMFALTLTLMAFAGTCAHAITHGWSFWKKVAPLFPLLALAFVCFVPSYYDHGDRPLLNSYRRLFPFRDLLEGPSIVLVTPGYGSELCNYLRSSSLVTCQGLFYYSLRDQKRLETSWPEYLDRYGVNYLYADQSVLEDPSIARFLSDPGASGWKVVALQDAPGRRWVLLRKDRASKL